MLAPPLPPRLEVLNMKAVAATPRTLNAVRKADALPRNLLNDKKRVNVSKINRATPGGTSIYWAKITAITDARNYTVDIYDRSDETIAIETGKQLRVFDIIDSIAVGTWIPVQASNITDKDYESVQQLGDI